MRRVSLGVHHVAYAEARRPVAPHLPKADLFAPTVVSDIPKRERRWIFSSAVVSSRLPSRHAWAVGRELQARAPKFDSTPRRCGWLHAGARARSSTGVTGAGAALSHGLAPRPSVLNEKQLRRSYRYPADSAGDGKGLAQEVSVFDSASKKKTAARAALVGRY